MVDGGTRSSRYASRLVALQSKGWKQRLRLLDPYRWNVRRLCPGRTLDVGCGIGRNLAHLDGRGVGVDHNPDAVAVARSRGLEAVLPEELQAEPGSFDNLLLAHVLEHLDADGAQALVAQYLPYVRPGGRVVLITPQERGQASDDTHVRFVDLDALRALCQALSLEVAQARSFPFPRALGRWFIYNEFVVVAHTPLPHQNG